jgi:phosphatidylcholine synthase
LGIIVVLALLTFVPTRYLYPSLPGKLNRVMSILGIPWTISLFWMISQLPDSTSRRDPSTLWFAWASLSYPLLYLGASWAISVSYWLRSTPATPDESA